MGLSSARLGVALKHEAGYPVEESDIYWALVWYWVLCYMVSHLTFAKIP